MIVKNITLNVFIYYLLPGCKKKTLFECLNSEIKSIGFDLNLFSLKKILLI